MSWMITDADKLDGSCYIEVLPGRYTGQFWNSQSVFFKEIHFSFIELFILRHCPKYDHYAFTDINKTIWQRILIDLNHLYESIVDSTKIFEMKDDGELPLITSSNLRFLNSELANINAMCEMLDDFIRWISDILKNHDTIAVLGM